MDWLLTDGSVTDKPTYIGEFSNLQRGDISVSPHGWACCRMTLRYTGAPRIVSMDFPQLSSRYAVSMDGTCLIRGVGSGRITFLLTPGDHVLTVETSSRAGYYSGMYFPPALSTDGVILRVRGVQSFAYTLAFLLPLVLPGGLLLLGVLMPVLPWAVFVHGKLTDIYYIFTFCCTVFSL